MSLKLQAFPLSPRLKSAIADQARFPIEDFRSIQRWKADIMALPAWKKTVALQVPPGRAA